MSVETLPGTRENSEDVSTGWEDMLDIGSPSGYRGDDELPLSYPVPESQPSLLDYAEELKAEPNDVVELGQ